MPADIAELTKRSWLRGGHSVVDLGRYKEGAFVLGAVLAAVLLLNSVLERLHSFTSIHDQATRLQLSHFDRLRAGQAVARLEDELEAKPGPLGVVLGLSTAMVGINPRLLAGHGGLRWANLAANGGSFTELLHYAEPLLASDLRPDVVVIGAHAVWLAERGEVALPIPEANALSLMLPTPWFWTARNSLRLAANIPIQRAHLVLLRALGVSMKVLFPGVAYDPSLPRWDYPAAHAAPDWIAGLDSLWVTLSWFEDSAYHASSPEVGRLRWLITELQARGATVVFVILPEPPATRDKLPAPARALLLKTLDSIGAVSLLDHWIAIGDTELFYDRMHLNADGRMAYSKRLAADLLPFTVNRAFKPIGDQP